MTTKIRYDQFYLTSVIRNWRVHSYSGCEPRPIPTIRSGTTFSQRALPPERKIQDELSTCQIGPRRAAHKAAFRYCARRSLCCRCAQPLLAIAIQSARYSCPLICWATYGSDIYCSCSSVNLTLTDSARKGRLSAA
jgi:hypothetical protein